VISEAQHLNCCRVPIDANVELVSSDSSIVALEEQVPRRQIATAPEAMRRKRPHPGIHANDVNHDRKDVDLRLCRKADHCRAAYVVEIDKRAAAERP
jgi:hypothetical protein